MNEKIATGEYIKRVARNKYVYIEQLSVLKKVYTYT